MINVFSIIFNIFEKKFSFLPCLYDYNPNYLINLLSRPYQLYALYKAHGENKYKTKSLHSRNIVFMSKRNTDETTVYIIDRT